LLWPLDGVCYNQTDGSAFVLPGSVLWPKLPIELCFTFFPRPKELTWKAVDSWSTRQMAWICPCSIYHPGI